ncbi:MAG TPA: hypothetical protein PKD48_19520 [Sphingopyxis sp.]|nr:hypothetical protein [Sphingopyxis sp.]
MIRLMALTLAAALPATILAAAAPPKAPACPAEPVLPEGLEGWSRTASNKTIYAYGDRRAIDWTVLGPVRTALSLHGFESLRYWVAPERTPDVHKFGGMVPITVDRPGRLVVALDAGAWIDLVQDGAIVKSAAHGHGPACSGIRKMVEYDVAPGRYLLQIVNAPDRSIRAMAVLR